MKGLFRLIGKLINGIVSYFEQGNKTHRKLKRIDSKAICVFRDVLGYYLEDSARLNNAQLEEVFLPESQSADEAWRKLCNLNKDKRYSILLLLIWGCEYAKPINFADFPRLG